MKYGNILLLNANLPAYVLCSKTYRLFAYAYKLRVDINSESYVTIDGVRGGVIMSWYIRWWIGLFQENLVNTATADDVTPCVVRPSVAILSAMQDKQIIVNSSYLWPLLLTWFNFNPSMDK